MCFETINLELLSKAHFYFFTLYLHLFENKIKIHTLFTYIGMVKYGKIANFQPKLAKNCDMCNIGHTFSE
jgi:hypothetical protein